MSKVQVRLPGDGKNLISIKHDGDGWAIDVDGNLDVIRWVHEPDMPKAAGRVLPQAGKPGSILAAAGSAPVAVATYARGCWMGVSLEREPRE